MAKKKSEVEAEKFDRWLFFFDRVFRLIDRTVPWCGAIGLAYVAIYLPVRDGGGGETTINVALKLLGDFKANEWLAYIFGGGGILYGMSQRKLRKDTVERLQERNARLESILDPNRTSSELTPRGDSPE